MSRTANSLQQIDDHVQESMGVRSTGLGSSPAALKVDPRDVGRRPLPEVASIEIDQVIPDPDQPRAEFSSEALQRLSDSIRDRGQLSPILVRWSDHHQKWVIIAGERRWRATKHADLEFINCHCRTERYSDSQILEQQLIENCLREDLTPVEEARAFRRLVDLNGWTGKQLAESLRVSPTRVSRLLAVLRLPDDLLSEVESGKLSTRSAYELTKLPSATAQRKMAQQIVEQSLTATQTSNAIRQRKGKTRRRRTEKKLTFRSDSGNRLVILPHRAANYAEIEEFVTEVLNEVRHRLENNVHL